MSEQTQAAGVRRRRSRAEVEQIVAEFEASGLSRTDFCRAHGLSLSTLNRYRNRRPQQAEARLLAVELSRPDQTTSVGGSGLAVILASGCRIEVGCGFDACTLAQLLRVLERA